MTGLVVVGSGPAGVAAAEAFRENDGRAPVRILTEDAAAPYPRPPLSKEYLQGKDADLELHPAAWFDERSIELSTDTRVDHLDTSTNSVVDVSGKRYDYDWLVLACGAGPKSPSIPGGESALLLRSLGDAVTLRDRAEGARTAVVIGAGFIGCEAAASLAMRGIPTILVSPEPLPQGARLGSAVGRRIMHLLADAGVSYAGGVNVTGLGGGQVSLDSGISIAGDLVLAATGVQPRVELADAAGLNTSEGRIVVDEHQRTSVANVFAAGDVALTHNRSAGRSIAVEHWQDAIEQGKVAGANASGGAAAWDSVPGFWTTIGDATLKYHAWGDGFDNSRLVEHGDGFTVWYEADGRLVGVLTLDADDDYERAEKLIQHGEPVPVG
jgi:3-phenylpropionate/trans-cinnamate dioxygenase ferredoxin reductase component